METNQFNLVLQTISTGLVAKIIVETGLLTTTFGKKSPIRENGFISLDIFSSVCIA